MSDSRDPRMNEAMEDVRELQESAAASFFALEGSLPDNDATPTPTPPSSEPPREEPKKRGIGGVGMPASLLLDEFGALVNDAFQEAGFGVYHVGSSIAQKRDWRDVDVRLILSDEEYESMGFGNPEHPHQNAKWVALVRAFSALGREMTGLPIDFQIQQQTDANAKHPGIRSALGVHTYFRRRPEKQ